MSCYEGVNIIVPPGYEGINCRVQGYEFQGTLAGYEIVSLK